MPGLLAFLEVPDRKLCLARVDISGSLSLKGRAKVMEPGHEHAEGASFTPATDS